MVKRDEMPPGVLWRGGPGEPLPLGPKKPKGIRQQQVMNFLKSNDDWREMDLRGLKSPDQLHTALRGAIRSMDMEERCYPIMREGRIFLVRGEPNYADHRRRRF